MSYLTQKVELKVKVTRRFSHITMNKKLLFLIFTLISFQTIHAEICDNGIDDDGDGLIDLNDSTDCNCYKSTIESLIPNPSFEELAGCCPSGLGDLACAQSWVQASYATSDFFNTCGTFTYNSSRGPNNGITPYPNGNGVAGFLDAHNSNNNTYFKEYLGVCLPSSLVAGESYTLEMNIYTALMNSRQSRDFDLTIWGADDCSQLPFNSSQCPAGITNFEILNSTRVIYDSIWQLITITFTPTQNIQSILVGPNCALPLTTSYYYIDNLILNKTSVFEDNYDLIIGGNSCQQINLTNPIEDDVISYQWYKDGIAIIGENQQTYSTSSLNQTSALFSCIAYFNDGCRKSNDVTLQNTFLQANIVVQNATCENSNDGILEIQNNYNFPPYIYEVNGVTQTDSIFTSLSSGDKQVVITDALACSDTLTINLEYSDTVIADFINSSVCVNVEAEFESISTSNNGSIEANNWSLSQEDSYEDNTFNHTFNEEGNRVISLVSINTNGCSDTTTQTVNINARPSAKIILQDKCIDENGNISFYAQSNSNNQIIDTWDWKIESSNYNTQSVEHNFENEGTNTVTLSITSNEGCEAIFDTTITVYEPIKGNFSFEEDEGCPLFCSKVIDETQNNPNFKEKIWLSNSISLNESNFAFCIENSGEHMLSLVTTDVNNCNYTVSKTVTVHPKPIANFSVEPDFHQNSSTFSFESIDNDLLKYLFWDFGDDRSGSSLIEKHSYEQPGEYDVKLIETNIFNCKDTITKTIIYEIPFQLWIPNSFSPNLDAINDEFAPINALQIISDYEFKIFNRWGSLVFKTNDTNIKWTGTENNKPAPEGLYNWSVQYQHPLSLQVEKRYGYVNLLR